MCVMVPPSNKNQQPDLQRQPDLLRHCQALRKEVQYLFHKRKENVVVRVVNARVPVLKFSYSYDNKYDVDCDVCVNNENALRNTHLLHTYSHLDDRVRPLVMVVKEWARINGINDAAKGTLSSYALTLMCLHFLQCGCDQAIVPSLQKSYPEYFNIEDVVELVETKPWEEIPQNTSTNAATDGELLLNFFDYFSSFPWEKERICIFEGRSAITSELPTTKRYNAHGRFMHVLDPFSFLN